MYDICCIGHLTLDKVVTPGKVMNMAGGTSFYFSNAICNMDVRYILVTSLARKEEHFVTGLQEKNIEVNAIYGSNTVYFENIYPANMDHRVQKVSQTADAFRVEQINNIDASIFHLGPLLAGDIPLDVLKALSLKGRVSLDVQGYLRQVENQDVFAIDWKDKKEGLRYVDILKANEFEMEVLTGSDDVRESARMLSDWGVKEVVITLGSRGSVIYTENIFYDIPAFVPGAIVDTTGCGDTYMAGYLYQRTRLATAQDAGEFGAAMASLKIESHGPFTGTETKVLALLSNHRKEIR
jgi:sugar/nucleoside kinase (ribokinase family)